MLMGVSKPQLVPISGSKALNCVTISVFGIADASSPDSVTFFSFSKFSMLCYTGTMSCLSFDGGGGSLSVSDFRTCVFIPTDKEILAGKHATCR